MSRFLLAAAAAIGMALSLAACSDPYNPGQRAVGGGLIGAGAGAAIGGLAGVESGALAGGLLGGAVGAMGGAATTPGRPQSGYQQSGYQQNYPPPPPPLPPR